MIKAVRPKEQTSDLVNPFTQAGKWFKANFHTHTTASDGNVSLEIRVQQYRDRGYNILAITDHDVINDVSSFCEKDFLVISGMETHPPCPFESDLYHLVCLNVPMGFSFPKNSDAETRIALVKKSGGEVIFAHPYWNGFNINHLLTISGYIGIEVYNATATKIGKACSSVQWDDLLTYGRYLPAMAVDDAHQGRDIFMGWTMIKARSLTVKSVLQALRTGCYYSSCGPIIENFSIKDKAAILRCTPAVEIHFIGQKYFGKSFYLDGDKELTSARYDIPDDVRYLRAEVVDRDGNRAWTNPIVLKAKSK
jgi:hypothetical protein